ncbi:MAG: DUF3035 domain-containing protein [Pseudomonadota bacterium]
MTRFPSLFRSAQAAALLACALTAGGCGGLGKALGVGKSPPDEFAIVTRAPLVVPPDFALRPPRPGEARPQELSTSQRAQVALFGVASTAEPDDGQPSLGEQVMMQNAGVLSSDPNIRALVDAEAGGIGRKSTSLANQIIFWRTDGPNIDDSEAPLVVDNPEEWLANRRKAIENVVGEGAEVRIGRSRILNLPGVK